MQNGMLLKNKTVVIYGAGGAVGGAVARAAAKGGGAAVSNGPKSRFGEIDRKGHLRI